MPCSCYLCCTFSIIILILLIAYWYIALPIIIILLISYMAISHQKNVKYISTLDSPKNQEIFTRETGFLPLKEGKLTKEYKEWLRQKDKNRKIASQLPPTQQTEPPIQPPAFPKQQLQEQPDLLEPSISSKDKLKEPEILAISSKELKVRFKDYTRNEKIIRIIFELIGMTILIIFIAFIIMSFIHQNFVRGFVYLLILIILMIPFEIIERVLQNRARKRKAKKYEEFITQKTFPSQPPSKLAYQTPIEPSYKTSLTQSQKVEKIICPYCGAENLKENKFCKECGSKLE
ncbi:MAG: zinc-ribbon domain-containing protein [Promethearchaeota archaeon]